MSFLSSFSLSWVIHHVRIHPAVSTTRSCIRCIHTTSNRRASSDAHSGKVHQHHHHPSSSSDSASIQTFHTKNGKVKIDLSNRSLIGVHQSRGERAYQEDTFAIHSVDVLSDECRRALLSPSNSNTSSSSSAGSSLAGGIRTSSTAPRGGEEGSNNTDLPSSSSSTDKEADKTEQSLYCAVFDGHNGSQVSTFLSHNLHQRILSTQQHEANDIVSQYRSLGGYMRRYRGGLLSGMVEPPAPRRMKRIERELKVDEERRAREDRGEVEPESNKRSQEEQESAQQQQHQQQDRQAAAKKPNSKEYPPWNLLQRLEATFLKTDLEIIETEKDAGSTATVALLHSLDEPRNPFFASEELHLILAHCGDTRALLCTVPEGTAVRLTETHHPEARSETDRLMRIRTGAVTDSFGESRWAGSLANTRAFGDAHYKALGVFSEPQLISQTISGSNTAFLILLSDGITEVLSDQEICDLSSRGFTNPSHAARNVISFAESVGAQDNLTCLIVPLQGWGKVKGNDSTLKRRELRVANYEGRSNRQNRM